MNKKMPECIKWGLRWAMVVLIVILLFFITSWGVEKLGGSGILEGISLICLILLILFSSPLEVILNLIPGQQPITIINCKIMGCAMNFTGIISIILLWFILGTLIGLIIVCIKKRMNMPDYFKIFKV